MSTRARTVLKVCSLAGGGLLVSLGVFALYLRPYLEPAPPDATRLLVLAMAEHLFKESHFPVLVRRDNNLAGCGQVGAEGSVLLLGQQDQQAVTEFVYTSGLVCVHTYLSRRQAPQGQETADLNSGHYEARLGELRARAYYGDRQMGFRFPASPGGIVAGEIAEFLQRIPRYFNARAEGGLANMVAEFESPQAVAQTLVQKVAAQQPKDKPAPSSHRGWFALLGLGLASLAIPALRPAWKHFHLAVHRKALARLPATPPLDAISSPAAPPVVSEQELQDMNEREEKVIRMIALLKESITEEAGLFAANLIFAKAGEAVIKAGKRGVAPHNAERLFLAGKLAGLLENRHRRQPDRIDRGEPGHDSESTNLG